MAFLEGGRKLLIPVCLLMYLADLFSQVLPYGYVQLNTVLVLAVLRTVCICRIARGCWTAWFGEKHAARHGVRNSSLLRRKTVAYGRQNLIG